MRVKSAESVSLPHTLLRAHARLLHSVNPGCCSPSYNTSSESPKTLKWLHFKWENVNAFQENVDVFLRHTLQIPCNILNDLHEDVWAVHFLRGQAATFLAYEQSFLGGMERWYPGFCLLMPNFLPLMLLTAAECCGVSIQQYQGSPGHCRSDTFHPLAGAPDSGLFLKCYGLSCQLY